MTIQSMNELFHHELQGIYYAENQIAKSLSEMMDQATDAALVDNFEHHLEDTHEQIKRLEQVFRALGQSPKGVTCQAILGLIEESQETLREIEDERVRDAAILASAQAMERYEITRYGTLVAWADQLGRTIGADQTALGGLEIVDLLQLTLDEEKNQDSRLTALAESRINRLAA
jgi:ferritin-like metal-binding protein YciE